MKSSKIVLIIGCALAVANVFGAESPALTKLQGKWSGKRTASDGQEVTQVIDIKGDKLTFQMLNADKETRIFARGIVKAETLGPFTVLKITDVEGGRSESELRPVNDDRQTIYVLRGDTLTLASNFDKDRENENPRVEVYQRAAASKGAASTPGPDAVKLAGKWKVTVKLGEDDRDYEMYLSQADGKLAGTLISPRSGEHKFKTVSFANGKMSMELPREIEGNEVTFVYTGELKGSELAGDVTVKGYEDQFKGTWKASK